MTDTARLFIAINLPDAIKNTLQEAQEALNDKLNKIAWVKPDNIHLTLKFLGDTPIDKINSIISVLDNIAAGFTNFELMLDTTGVFPDFRRPRIVWVGLSVENSKLQDLAGIINNKLSSFGFEKEIRAFVAHLTIGRVKFIKEKQFFENAVKNFKPEALKFAACGISLYKSTLNPKGAVYEQLHCAPFKKP